MNIEKPWIINIELTNACNLECCFCDHAVLKKKMAIKSMDDSLLKKVFSDIEEYEHDNKIYELGLVGLGEPTLDKHFERHIEFINSHAYMFERISFNSNLVSLGKKHADILLASKINAYTFSVNASGREAYLKMMGKNKFDAVIENLKYFLTRLKKKSVKARVDIQLLDSDKNDPAALRALFPPALLTGIHFFTRKVYNKPAIQHNSPPLRIYEPDDLKRYPCWDIYTRVYIDVEGNLYPCTIGNDSYREGSHLCLGNVRNDNLFNLFNNKIIREARYKSEKGELPFPECDKCNIWALTPNNFEWDRLNKVWNKKEATVRAYGLKN